MVNGRRNEGMALKQRRRRGRLEQERLPSCSKFANELTESERAACVEQVPELIDRGGGNPVACHHAQTVELL